MAGLKEYWQELAQKAGIPADRMQAVSEALGDDAVAKVFSQGFVTRSDYSRDLDKTRDEWKGKVGEYEKWYAEIAEPAYKQNLSGLTRLRQYEQRFGKIEDAADVKQAATATGLSKDEVKALLDEQIGTVRAQTAALLKTVPRLVARHVREFGEEPDLDAVEKIAIEKGLSAEQAYNEWAGPKYKEKSETALNERIKKEREEAVRDYASKHKLPVEAKPRESHPFFDRKDSTKLTDREQRDAGKNAFLDTLNDPNYRENSRS